MFLRKKLLQNYKARPRYSVKERNKYVRVYTRNPTLVSVRGYSLQEETQKVNCLLNTYDDTVRAINKWQPAQHDSDELQYRDDLLKYLKKEMNSTASYTYMPREKISVRKQEDAKLCDITVAQRAVGIKMKKDLTEKSDVDRLMAQLVGYKSEYDDLIVVLVGKTDEKAFEYLKIQLSTIKDNRYTAQQRIRLIRKT